MPEGPILYRRYELLFTPHLIAGLRDLRGEEWAKLIDYLSSLPDTHPAALAFSLMMIRLGSCLTCEMDSYKAQRGCAICSRQTITSFKGTDEELIQIYRQAQEDVERYIGERSLEKAA
jgi:hypothetical protein